MSTTFGLTIKSTCPYGDNNTPPTEETVEIAFRGSSYIRWSHPMAQLLPDDLKVDALDNDCSDILTVGDIRKAIEEQNVRRTTC